MSESKLIRVEDLEKMYQGRIDYFVAEGMATRDPDLHTIAGAVSGCLRIAKELVPAVDAVEVIRCRDCKHFLQYTDDAGDCEIWRDEMEIDGFCSYGERKENGE